MENTENVVVMGFDAGESQLKALESGEIKEEKVLKDINIEIEKGSFTAVLGHNGSGKSTLAKHFNAILLPSGGKVYVKGMDTADENNIFNIRQSAGMVFQNPDNQMVAALVEDEVAFAPENLGVEPKEIRRRVDECLEIVNMTKYAQSSPSKLSGGQKQRVAIASVLAMNPEILILDEPTASLGEGEVEPFLKFIKDVRQTMNIAIIFISHKIEELFAISDRIVVLTEGRNTLTDKVENLTQVQVIVAMLRTGKKYGRVSVLEKDFSKLPVVIDVKKLFMMGKNII